MLSAEFWQSYMTEGYISLVSGQIETYTIEFSLASRQNARVYETSIETNSEICAITIQPYLSKDEDNIEEKEI